MIDAAEFYKWLKIFQVSSGGTEPGFTQNATFVSTASSGAIASSYAPLNAGLQFYVPPDGSWSAAGDGFGMICAKAGLYKASAVVPLTVTAACSGLLHFAITSGLTGNSVRYNNVATSGMILVPLQTYLTCGAGEIVTLKGQNDSGTAPSLFYEAAGCQGVNIMFERIS